MSPRGAMEKNVSAVARLMRIESFPHVLRVTGLLVWLAISATTVLRAISVDRLALWAIASLTFAICFWRNVSRAQAAPLELALQAISVVAMVGVLCNGYEGFLLVLMAAQLGLWGRMRGSLWWITLEAAAIGIAIALHWSPRPAVLLVPPYFGFALLMYAATR